MSEKTLADYWADWEAHVFGYGYGSGEEHTIGALKGVFEAFNTDQRSYHYTNLERAIGPRVAWLLINTLCHADILEYGTSPRYAWLTGKGERLARFVREHSLDELVAMTRRDQDYWHCSPGVCNCGPDGHDGKMYCDNPFWGRS